MKTTAIVRRSLLGTALALPFALPALAQALTAAQRAEVVDVLRRALREDPSILRDAMTAIQAAEAAQAETRQRDAISASAEALFRDSADPIKGNPTGDVTIVEFFDARCGYCKQLHPAMEALLARDRNVRVVMKDLPILGPGSVQASRALLAAHRQGRYAALYDALMRVNGEPTEAVLRTQAERVGLDWARLRREMDDPAIQRRLDTNLALAQRLGIEGTPALIFSGVHRLVPGAVDAAALERMVAQVRAGG